MTFPDLPLAAFGDLLTLQRQCHGANAAILVRGDQWKVRPVWPTQEVGHVVEGREVVAVVKGAA